MSDDLKTRANKLRLYGLVENWDRYGGLPWVAEFVELEESVRARRSREYRIRNANIGAFKSMLDFDWKHPKKIDRRLIQDLLGLGFIGEGVNVVLLGPNGVGKTMIAQNLAHAAVLAGHPTRFVVASEMLTELAAHDGAMLKHRLKPYVNAKLLVIDEVGYLRYDNRYADLLYEVIRQRYERRRSVVVSTNKAFAEWNTVFESAACLVTLVDRLCHRAEIVEIHGESYRMKEAKARRANRRSGADEG
jgi:DNA replication protein DnaC